MDKNINLPQPGELIINNDFLEEKINNSEIRIIQWNIERGMNLIGIIKELKKLNADILIIQEIDIECERSKRVNCLKEIAAKLKMSYAYVSEFCELYSEVRSTIDQGGGVHGNALFSKFYIKKENSIAIKHTYQPVNWEKEGYDRKEPRKGDRYFIASLIEIVKGIFLDVYSIHLEVFCGISGRIDQFSDVPLYAKKRKDSLDKNSSIIQVIGGDLNTMAHGLARLSPKYCGNDWMRYVTIGKSEGKWWMDNALCGGDKAEKNLKWWGFNEDVCKNYVCFEGFFDPFDVEKDITVQNHWGLYYGKLDWIFIKGGIILNKFMGNHNYSLSDHKYLGIDIKIK